ncbi:hypothetical protein [Paraglaciecola psychrophila]|uniref:Uncharacterized protein n=1 Tax=Paraglaciecola psychrophila 170 TaxID=1129794 RepID=K7ATD6_9ALTE|nr:hypothetical protein [Paraglaciecola psychrophila]AGH44307.1 hypothetical protein C427_2198 [Paraglaciecola psychrophila 170]GAC38505.1 hypothetical protein GPSY_2894 [Paraglaciecola psychrophila 170]
MASITSVRLRVGRISSANELADLTIRVNWTARERQENMSYLVAGFLVERDDGRDFFDMLPGGGIHWSSVGNMDDFIGTVGRQWIRPNGSSSRTLTLRLNWNFGNQEIGSEEYLGVATVVPETRGDIRFSPEVSANLS